MGNLIGDFVLAGTGDEDADCLPHSEVAFFTEEKVDFSGEDSSLAGEISTFGGEISLSGVDLGLSATGFTGSVGSGRENLDWDTAGEGEGDIGFAMSTDFGVSAGFGVSIGLGSGGFCGVFCDPETLLSFSNDAGFLGTPGDDGFGDWMDSGRGDFLGMA